MLRIVGSVPAGRVVTFADIGAQLDVAPRHVADILAMLDAIEAATLPWHRAVAADGWICTPKSGPDGASNRALLTAEGAAFDPDGRSTDFVTLDALAHGVPVQTRPADAPSARPPHGARQGARRTG